MRTAPAPVPVLLPFSSDGGQLVEPVQGLRQLTDLVLPAATARALGRVITEHEHHGDLVARGLRPACRLLFFGTPGCGKTAAAGALAAALTRPLFRCRLDGVMSSFLGSTAKHLRQVFDMAKSQQVVLLLDEFDAIGSARDGQDRTDVAEMRRVVNSVLVMLEEITGPSIVVAATNLEGHLDAAVWRRFDEVVEFPRPSGVEAADLLRRVLARHDFAIASNGWPRKLQGLSFADVERVALDAAKAVALSGGGASIDYALASAIVRQRDRLALTSEKRGRKGSR